MQILELKKIMKIKNLWEKLKKIWHESGEDEKKISNSLEMKMWKIEYCGKLWRV